MKQFYILSIALLLCISITQAQTFDFSIAYVGINGSTNNHQLAFMATPSSTVTNGVTADMGAGFYIPTGLTIGNFVLGNSGLPTSEWSVQTLGASNANGDPYFVSRVEAGSSNIELNGAGPFELVLFDIIADPNPTSGNVTFVENGDPVFNEILFIQNYININLGSGTVDAYNQNDPAANSVDFSTLSTTDFEALLNEISIYPNPTSEFINISSSIQIDAVELFDLLGKRVIETKQTNQIRVDQLPHGVYLLRVYTQNGNLTKKIIIE